MQPVVTFFSSNPVTDLKRFSLIFKGSAISTNLVQPAVIMSVVINNNGKCATQINYTTHGYSNGTLSITNLLGQTVFSDVLRVQKSTVSTTLTSGVYIVTITGNGETVSIKVVLK